MPAGPAGQGGGGRVWHQDDDLGGPQSENKTENESGSQFGENIRGKRKMICIKSVTNLSMVLYTQLEFEYIA